MDADDGSLCKLCKMYLKPNDDEHMKGAKHRKKLRLKRWQEAVAAVSPSLVWILVLKVHYRVIVYSKLQLETMAAAAAEQQLVRLLRVTKCESRWRQFVLRLSVWRRLRSRDFLLMLYARH
jgi:hypothetical protein